MTDMIFGNSAQHSDESELIKWWRGIDRISLACVGGLFGIGIFLGFAASIPLAQRKGLDPSFFVDKQLKFGLIALFAMLFLSMCSIKFLRRLSIICFFIGLASLIALIPLGTDYGKGAVRWLSLGFMGVQPSEFVKPFFVVFVAWLMAGSLQVGAIAGRALSLIPLFLVLALLVWQPDYGQTSLILCTWIIMAFAVGTSLRLMIGLLGLIGAAGFIAYHSDQHFAGRIDGFLLPQIDPTSQIGLATGAIQEGGLFGAGLGEGSVKWSLPDAHTDFIIAVAAEEYGFVIVAVIIALFCTMVVTSLMRILKAKDPFVRIAAVGLAVMFGLQAMVNLGVASRLLPTKGMTLPLVSNGGSSLVAVGILLGLLFALTHRRHTIDRDLI